jgi:lipopolysaccharide/colanic/teichoic acid biosynthesis glycosyltransferase
MKRLFDVTASAFGIVLLAPILIVVALLVRQDSAGPVLFRQRRIGRAGVPFDILKFRTMRIGAADGGMAFDADRRVTQIGAVLRRTKLDELPQLFNVVGGSMSLVGPRPEVPDFVAHYSERDRAVLLSVRPGITDLASLRFRNEGAHLAREAEPERAYLDKILPRKLRLARYCVRRRSLCFDVILIWKTITTALGSPSIREPHIGPPGPPGGRA